MKRVATAVTAALTAALTALGLVVAGTAAAAPAAAVPAAVGAWTASPVRGETSDHCPGGPGALHGQTIRQTVTPSVAGDRVRVRLSNAFGTAPLKIGAASIARTRTGAAVVSGTLRSLRFSGRAAVTIPPGAEVVSDWTDLSFGAGQIVALSVYVPQFDGPATIHSFANQAAFLSGAGDHTRDLGAAGFPDPLYCFMIADGVDVQPAARSGSVVAFGDSITDGVGSNYNANSRWPDRLARRLVASGRPWSVVNQGISGNRLLSDAGTAGISALARFDRDVLAQPGARTAVVLEGVNDIGNSTAGTGPHVGTADVIAAYRQLIARAHDRGIRILGGTLTPYRGAGYWSAAGERIRQAVNTWIRTSGEFDGVVDFARAVESPDDPLVFDPRYDSGDHLHPNDAGYEAMANAVNLRALVR